MVGQRYSFSHNACLIEFEDGPLDGQVGLYDHQTYDVISIHKDGKQYDYENISDKRYALARVWRH